MIAFALTGCKSGSQPAPAAAEAAPPGAVELNLKPGDSVSLKRAPAQGRDTFLLQGSAGQMLRVELNTGCEGCGKESFDSVGGLRVVQAGANPPAEVPSRSPDACPGVYWAGVLPRDGTYHVLVDRKTAAAYVLEAVLLDPHDPRLEPGLTPDRVSMAKAPPAPESAFESKPYEPGPVHCEIPDLESNLPARISAHGKRLQAAVMRLDALKKSDPFWTMDLAALERAIAFSTAPAKAPLTTYGDAALAYYGKMEIVSGKNWRGLRWIAQFTQDYGEPGPSYEYFVAGVSTDGKYFIWITGQMEHAAALPGLAHLSVAEVQRLDDKAYRESYQKKVNTALDAAPGPSFAPPLAQFDAAARSLELR